MRPLIIHRKGEALLGRDGLTLESLPVEFQRYFPETSPKYIDSISLLAGIAAKRVLNGKEPVLEGERSQDFGVILGSAFGAIDSTVDFDSQALLKGPNAVNPMDFPNTVANAAGSRIGIWLQLKGPNVTLTNGDTALIDAIGFAWEAANAGLFRHCLVGAAEKVPLFLRSQAHASSGTVELKEGACFLLASQEQKQDEIFQVTDYFAVQLKPDLSLPSAFLDRLGSLWAGVDWLGCPEGTPVENHFPPGLVRFKPSSSVLELGLGGWEALGVFLASPQSCGIIAVFSKAERKISLIKALKTGRSV